MGLASSTGCHFLLAVLFFFHGFCWSEKAPFYTFVKEATLAPLFSRFDYIIVGGGTAGCPLAATLSQNASVLVLERGGSPYEIPKSTDIGSFATTLSDSSPESPSQPFVSEDGVYNARARVLGGGSVLNAGFYSRASRGQIKESKWDEKMVNASYEWVEKKVAFKPPMLRWQSAVRDGLLEAGVLPYNGFTYDHVRGTKVGGTIFDRKGHRHTAADLLEYANPGRISVFLRATVHQILFSTKGRPRPRAYGVIFQDAYGIFHKAELQKHSMNDVILSAGAIGSPQLLMLSGVGPAAHLATHGIKLLVDHPMVGQGMADNPMNAVLIPSPLPVEVSLIQAVGITAADGYYIEAASGMGFSYGWAQQLYRGVSSLFNQTNRDSTMSPESISDILKSMDPLLNSTTKAGVILEKISGPISRGNLQLRSTNPNDNPSVTFNYFNSPQDLKNCVQGITTIIKIINSKSFSKFRYREMSIPQLLDLIRRIPTNLRRRRPGPMFSLEEFCVDTVMTIWHYHGGCQIGKVVDRNFRVLGVNALRVIDGSTFLKSPGTNPQATVMMLGRYMGQRILKERAEFAERKKKKMMRKKTNTA